MTKTLLKILILLLTASSSLILLSCNLDNEDLYIPPPPDPGTGMWFVGRLNTNGDARYVRGHIINGTQFAFLADGQNGLQIINISDASNPSLTFNYKTNGNAKEVFIDSINGNKYAFISDIVKGLFILNITNPANVFLDTLIAYQQGVNSVKSKNGYLFTALNQGAIKIININSLPDSVYEVNSYNPLNPAEHIEISNNTAFLVEKITGLEIVDITNPSLPVFLSTFRSSGSCYDLKIADYLAYIADGNAGISVINIGNPAQPYFIQQTNTESDVRGIDYSPNFLFSAEYNDGAEVFNLFNPAYPEGIGYYKPQGQCYSIHYFKGKVLIANGQNGLLILRF